MTLINFQYITNSTLWGSNAYVNIAIVRNDKDNHNGIYFSFNSPFKTFGESTFDLSKNKYGYGYKNWTYLFRWNNKKRFAKSTCFIRCQSLNIIDLSNVKINGVEL